MLNTIQVFGEAVWHGTPNAPAHTQDAAAGQQTFIRGMLETPTEKDPRNPLDLAVSLLLHVLIVGVVLLIPLLYTGTIDLGEFENTFLVAPRPPAAAPPPEAAKVVKALSRPIPQRSLTQPVAIPAKIRIVHEAPPPEPGDVGVVGGVPGGTPGGALGGIIGGTGSIAPPPPPPATHRATNEIFRIGGDVKEPQVIYAPAPIYPPLARTTKTEGNVVLDAVIDQTGHVVQVQAVSGPALLMRAAMDAVTQWRYQPTILDGQAASIRMHVTVKFRLQ